MKKLLKIRFVKFEKALAMQILEQVGGFEMTNHIKVRGMPEMGDGHICLCGFLSARDYEVCVKSFEDNAVRDEYFQRAIKWISEEQFAAKGKLKIGTMCEVSDNRADWVERKLLTVLPKNYNDKYITQAGDDKNKWSYWKYARPVCYCNPQIDGDVYTWEMEAADER